MKCSRENASINDKSNANAPSHFEFLCCFLPHYLNGNPTHIKLIFMLTIAINSRYNKASLIITFHIYLLAKMKAMEKALKLYQRPSNS